MTDVYHVVAAWLLVLQASITCTSLDESIKITVRFLTNEIRSDGLRIIVHKKRCNIEQSCKITKISSAIEQELQVAILKKAVLFEREFNKNKKKFKRGEVK